MVVVVIDGVVNDVDPLPPGSTAPPEAVAYQSIVSPAPGVADNATVPVPQRDAGVPVGLLGTELIVAVTAVRAETQPVAVVLASA